MDFFHERLPVDKLLAGKPIEWNLSKPSISSFFYELGGGVADLFVEPYNIWQDNNVLQSGRSHAIAVALSWAEI